VATKNKSDSTAPATAAGQALGYSLQFTRLTLLLLNAPEGSFCSLEYLDDVALEAEGAVQLVQTKSALADNPVADRATSLWKTLYNWHQLVLKGFVDTGKTLFEIYVSRPVSGPIVQSFHTASDAASARAALEKARNEIWGEAPTHPLKAAIRDDLAVYVNAILSADEREILPLIQRMSLKCGGGSPQDDLETFLRSHPIQASKTKKVADYLCGWVKRRADERMEKSLPALIARDDFHAAYTAFCSAEVSNSILVSLGRKPKGPETAERLSDDFVRQLELIEATFEDKLEAVSDYLRACWDRAHWAEVGDVDENSFDELDDSLKRTWKNLSRGISIESKQVEELERGQLLLLKCMQHKAPLRGMTTPEHFTPGCFHRLSDGHELGWHPQFKTLLAPAPSFV
jgi:hypothetical protein